NSLGQFGIGAELNDVAVVDVTESKLSLPWTRGPALLRRQHRIKLTSGGGDGGIAIGVDGCFLERASGPHQLPHLQVGQAFVKSRRLGLGSTGRLGGGKLACGGLKVALSISQLPAKIMHQAVTA